MTDSGTPADEPVVTLGDNGALVTVDLSAPPETVGGVVGRIVGGLLLLVLGGALALGALVGAVASTLFDATRDWADLIADASLIVVPLGLAIALIGFELMRRGRKRKAGLVASTVAAPESAPRSAPAAPTDTPPAQPPKTLI